MSKKKKIKKSVSRRFKVTKMNKSKSRMRRKKEPGELTGTFAKKIKKMLGE